jgi:hypothetical protein
LEDIVMAVRKQQTLLIALVALTLGACGGDSSGNGGPGKGKDAGTQHGDGDGNGDGDADGGKISIGKDAGQPGVMLGDNTAGDACTKADDCPGGMCATSLSNGITGGTTPAPGGYCSAQCSKDEECGKGGACAGALSVPGQGSTKGSCEQVCTKNADCRDGYYCAAGLDGTALGGAKQADTCRPKPMTGMLSDNVSGSACATAGDCAGTGGECATKLGEVVPGTGGTTAPGGYCTATCIEDANCGGGGICVVGLTGGTGKCYQGCTKDECTRDGYGCVDVGSKGQKGCSPVKQALPEGTVGKTCTGAGDCSGGTCATDLPTHIQGMSIGTTPAPGGYCTSSCTKDEECGTGAACAGSFSFGTVVLAEGSCAVSCTTKDTCRPGYDCIIIPNLPMQMKTCLPDGTTPVETDAGTPATDAGH